MSKEYICPCEKCGGIKYKYGKKGRVTCENCGIVVAINMD